MAKLTNIPEVKRYFIKYRKSNGQIHSYNISTPIDRKPDAGPLEIIIVYARNRGVRSFRVNQIIELKEV